MVKFYTEGLGLPLLRGRTELPSAGRHYYTVKCGDTILKLWAFDDGPAAHGAQRAEPNERMGHVGFRYLTILVSSDLEVVADRLESLGFALSSRPRASATGYPGDIFFTQDPDGNWLEIVRLHDPQWDPYAE